MVSDAEDVSLCTLRVGDAWFGFNTGEVYEVRAPQAVHVMPLAPDFVAGVIQYRGEILTILSFRKLLKLEPLTKLSNIVVLENEREGELFGLAVDAMGDVLSVAGKCFEEHAEKSDWRRELLFAGRYVLSDRYVTHLKPNLFWPMRLMELFGNDRG